MEAINQCFLKENAVDAYVTAISIGELYRSARMLSHGKRREGIMDAIDDIAITYQYHVLPFDFAAAKRSAVLQEQAHSQGRVLTVEAGMILAICQVNNDTLVTRNVKDFDYLTDKIINPWKPAEG